ncbi:putative alcohol oxidase protein [Neofusicoccum parvum]|uniref:Alcohol oxidase protein n=1 Tax=Neofusicoccum parvum TaxID=310453 RepID=A0ACB5RYN8_9PEZI|nr:putative alcohol oxidase protein [Neofusicoccum parvum]
MASLTPGSSLSLLHLLVCSLALSPTTFASVLPRQSNATSYDFIIIGGGTAGLALSARLSTSAPAASVLVLEAGPAAFASDGVNVAGKRGTTIGGAYDWNLTSVAQPLGGGRAWAQTRGRVLGGSSALNLMCWNRATVAEYDVWGQEEFGDDPGWGWDGMYAAMLAVENFTRPSAQQEAAEGGVVYGEDGVAFGGPVQTVVNAKVPAQQAAFIPAMEALGIERNVESLNGSVLGTMRQPSSVRATDYSRSYSAAYLDVAGANLEVRTETTVARVNFADERDADGRVVATGVTLADGTVITAAKEVVLSAGALLSPPLLEASGIGNASILSAAGIEPLVDLPGVGENLQDHMRIQTSYQLKPEYTSFDKLRYNATYAAEQLALWHAGIRGGAYDYTGSGYAYMTWADAFGANSSTTASLLSLASAAADPSDPISAAKLAFLADPTVPSFEIIFSDGFTGAKGYPARNSTLYGQGFFTLIGALQHTFSRGAVHVNASDVSGPPVIDPRYFSAAYDKAALIAMARHLRDVAHTPPLRDLWVAEYEPGEAAVPLGSGDAEWEAYVDVAAATVYHPMGTAAMMAKELGGVVDPALKVYGTANVRVVDASVMPVQLSAHIQTAVYGIAERAAKMIAEEWA